MVQFYTNSIYTTTINETSNASSQTWPITTYSKYLSSAEILHLTLVCYALSHTNRMWFHHKFISEILWNFLLTHSVHFNIYSPTRTDINKCWNIQDIEGGRTSRIMIMLYTVGTQHTIFHLLWCLPMPPIPTG
jgi:hypothetical protein